MPISRQVRMIRTAISPRFAIRTFGLLATRVSCLPWTSRATSPRHAEPRRPAGGARRDPGRCSRACRGGYRFDECDGDRARRGWVGRMDAGIGWAPDRRAGATGSHVERPYRWIAVVLDRAPARDAAVAGRVALVARGRLHGRGDPHHRRQTGDL